MVRPRASILTLPVGDGLLTANERDAGPRALAPEGGRPPARPQCASPLPSAQSAAAPAASKPASAPPGSLFAG